MILERDGDKLVIRETPGCAWIAGLLFAVVGGLFVYGALGGFSNSGSQPWYVPAVAFVFGSAGVIAGIRIITRSPITKISIDRTHSVVVWTRFGFMGRETDVYRFDVVRQFCLIEERDDEGAEIWTFGMELINGEFLRIGVIASHFEENERRLVFAANEFAGKQLTAVEMALGGDPDDNDAELRN